MKTIFLVAALVVAANALPSLNHTKWIDYRLLPDSISSRKGLIQPRDVTCTAAGNVCDPDCERIWTCIYDKDVGYKPALKETCEAPQTCNNGVCSTVTSRECSPAAQKPFVCNAEGVFPDPITCKKYHFCISQGAGAYDDTERDCQPDPINKINFGYNPRTTYCDKKLAINDQCAADYPVPICTTGGQNGGLKDNPSIFYVCSIYENQGNVLYPYLYLCPNGRPYNGKFDCK